jgi:hypothetical protein
MQDRYAFDVGDFGKFGLLRHLLSGDESLSLGVIWYATTLGSQGNDGKHVAYLDLGGSLVSSRSDRYRGCDVGLYDLFRKTLLKPGSIRSIAALESLNLIPRTTVRYFRAPTPAGAGRSGWYTEAAAAVRNCDVVFCDPDNGIATPRSRNERFGSARHILVSEIADLHARGHSLVIYHHLTRASGGHNLEMLRWVEELTTLTGVQVTAIRFRRGTSRAFFVIPNAKHQVLTTQLDRLSENAWTTKGHFQLALRHSGHPPPI